MLFCGLTLSRPADAYVLPVIDGASITEMVTEFVEVLVQWNEIINTAHTSLQAFRDAYAGLKDWKHLGWEDTLQIRTLQGSHVYQGCFTMGLGGSLTVPANKTLEIWATCFTMTAGTTVSLGTGASFIVHASDVVDLAGAINGGSLVKLMAWTSLNDAGSINSATVILRADQLSYKAGASVAGTSAALYGASLVNEASFPGSISVMPPESLSSVSAPDPGWWNWSPAGIDISWPRPFPGVIGYYAHARIIIRVPA